MADDANKTASWWGTLPGILTAIAAVITAVTGLVAILSKTGVFGDKSRSVVGQKAADARDAVSTPSSKDVAGPGAGIAGRPSQSTGFTGAVGTLRNGTVVKLRDDIKEYCQGRPLLKTLDGQQIEMTRIRRFELSAWDAMNQRGSAHIVLDSGATVDTRIEGCFMVGTSDLGAYKGPFEDIRAVEFVR